MSSCLLPQFKCQPDSFSIHFRTSFSVSKQNKGTVFFQPQCAVSTSPALLTPTLDVAKLRLPSFDTQFRFPNIRQAMDSYRNHWSFH